MVSKVYRSRRQLVWCPDHFIQGEHTLVKLYQTMSFILPLKQSGHKTRREQGTCSQVPVGVV